MCHLSWKFSQSCNFRNVFRNFQTNFSNSVDLIERRKKYCYFIRVMCALFYVKLYFLNEDDLHLTIVSIVYSDVKSKFFMYKINYTIMHFTW